MKKIISLGLILVVFAVALTTIAAAPSRTFSNPMPAAENHKPTKSLMRHYQRENYDLYNAFENAYRYFAQPEGDYDWGTVTFQLKSASSNSSLIMTYVTVTVYIRYIEAEDAFQVSGFDVRETTAY